MWRKMKWNVKRGNVKHTALLLRVIEITFYQHTSSNANSPVNLLYVCNLQWYSTCPHCLTWPLWVRRNEGGDGTAAVSISLWTQPPVETSNVQSVRRPTSGIAASTGIWSTSAVRRPVSNAPFPDANHSNFIRLFITEIPGEATTEDWFIFAGGLQIKLNAEMQMNLYCSRWNRSYRRCFAIENSFSKNIISPERKRLWKREK